MGGQHILKVSRIRLLQCWWRQRQGIHSGYCFSSLTIVVSFTGGSIAEGLCFLLEIGRGFSLG
jgi:hypothetical protein